MTSDPIEGQCDEPPMKARTRPRREQTCNERMRNTETSQSACDVDPVRSTEYLDQRFSIVGRGDLVVVADYPFDLANPRFTRVGNKVLTRERDRWCDVIERLVRPDPEIMEHCRHCNLLEFSLSGHQHAEIHDSIHVVPVA